MASKMNGNNMKLYVNDMKSMNVSHQLIQREKHKKGIMLMIWSIENNYKPTTDQAKVTHCWDLDNCLVV